MNTNTEGAGTQHFARGGSKPRLFHRRSAARPLKYPDVVLRVDGDATDLAEEPVCGSGFGQYGSTRNAGLCALARAVEVATASNRSGDRPRVVVAIFSPSVKFFRFGDRRRAFEKVEVAALVGLADMRRNTWRRSRAHKAAAGCPGGAPARKFVVADMRMDAACRDVDLDLVAGLHQRQRAADKTFRGDVQDAGAITVPLMRASEMRTMSRTPL